MKTRIKVVENRDGQVWYIPQKRFLWVWSSFVTYVGEGEEETRCRTVEGAKEVIDRFLGISYKTGYIPYP